MISLFIDTSLVSVSISVVKDHQILSIIQKEIPNLHSAYATSFVKEALDKAKIDANEVDNIMVVNGPGSFTGVRIGVTIAKTYGYLIDKYVTPISSLKALALSANKKEITMSIIPANKTHYYVGIYDETYNNLIEEQFTDITTINELCREYHPYIVGPVYNIIGTNKINKVNLDVLKITDYYLDKPKVNYHVIVPNYLKLPQALEDKK